MMCLFERAGEKNGRPICRCTREGCGRAIYSDTPEQCHAVCRADRGWGDKLSDFLSHRLRITERSYRRFKVRWGLKDACGCGERRERLNRIGRRVAAIRKSLAQRWPRQRAR